LMYRPPLSIRAHYLVLGGDAPTAGVEDESVQVPSGLPALAVITLGIQYDRVVTVRMPPIALEPDMDGWIHAMGASVGGELGETIINNLEMLKGERDMNVCILPQPDMTGDDFAQMMRSMDRPIQPMVNFMIQMNLGGGALFSSSVHPSITSHVPGRGSGLDEAQEKLAEERDKRLAEG